MRKLLFRMAVLMLLLLMALTAFGVHGLMRFRHRAKESEAHVNLHRLATLTRDYRLRTGHFPASVGWTPSDSACDHEDQRYPVHPALWKKPTWRALGFTIDRPSHFQYRIESHTSHARLLARGDLDCDGLDALFELSINADGTLGQ